MHTGVVDALCGEKKLTLHTLFPRFIMRRIIQKGRMKRRTICLSVKRQAEQWLVLAAGSSASTVRGVDL